MSDLIKREDAIKAIKQWRDNDGSLFDVGLNQAIREIKRLPSADRPQGEWIDTAISIIDDMQREGIIDYEQAWEFRMRARMKGE